MLINDDQVLVNIYFHCNSFRNKVMEQVRKITKICKKSSKIGKSGDVKHVISLPGLIMGGMGRVDLNSAKKSQRLNITSHSAQIFSEVAFMYLERNVQGKLL